MVTRPQYPLIEGSQTWVPEGTEIEAETEHYVMFVLLAAPPPFSMLEELWAHGLRLASAHPADANGAGHLVCEKDLTLLPRQAGVSS